MRFWQPSQAVVTAQAGWAGRGCWQGELHDEAGLEVAPRCLSYGWKPARVGRLVPPAFTSLSSPSVLLCFLCSLRFPLPQSASSGLPYLSLLGRVPGALRRGTCTARSRASTTTYTASTPANAPHKSAAPSASPPPRLSPSMTGSIVDYVGCLGLLSLSLSFAAFLILSLWEKRKYAKRNRCRGPTLARRTPKVPEMGRARRCRPLYISWVCCVGCLVGLDRGGGRKGAWLLVGNNGGNY